jgi:hypothetical protein
VSCPSSKSFSCSISRDRAKPTRSKPQGVEHENDDEHENDLEDGQDIDRTLAPAVSVVSPTRDQQRDVISFVRVNNAEPDRNRVEK